MKKIWINLFILLFAAMLIGCRPKESGSLIIVNRITVIGEKAGQSQAREFTANEDIRKILGAIRLVGEKSNAGHDPDAFPGPGYRIILTHTNGSQHTVCTKFDRFIRDGNSRWQQANPEGISRLHRLLESLCTGTDMQDLQTEITTIFNISPA